MQPAVVHFPTMFNKQGTNMYEANAALQSFANSLGEASKLAPVPGSRGYSPACS